MLTLLVNKASLSTLHRILGTVSLACPHKVVTFSGTVGEIPPAPVVVAMGGHALNKLKELGLVKKNLSLTSNRGKVISVGETNVLLTFDPTLALREAERLPDIQWDLQLGSRFAATGSLAPQVGVYRYVPSLAAVVGRLFAEADAAPRQVSLDLETIGLDPFAPEARVVSITVTFNAGQSSVYLPPEGKLPPDEHEALRLLVTSPLFKLVGANLKFDALWLAVHYGIWISNHKLDTQLVGSLLDENRSNSLNVHTKVYVPALGGYDDAMNRTHDKSRMDLVLEQDPEGFLTYAGGDTDACYRVANIMRTRISTDARLRNFYTRLLHPASTAFTKLEYRGVVVDRERYSELQAECEAEISTLERAAIDLMPRRLRYKHLRNLALTRPQVIKDFMFGPTGLGLTPLVFTEKGGEPSTASDHLQMFSDVPEAAEFVRILGQYSVAKKILSTYIVGFLKHLRADGRFHPSYRLSRGGTIGDAEAGTLTGRLSASDPAWQTVPMRSAWAPRLRSVYVPPPGHGILKLDYSQGELRIVAELANEPTMLRAYRDGLDLHAITAAETMGLTFERFLALPEAVIEEKRRAAKAINFGLCVAEGQRVLTDQGLVPIENVTAWHKVWDGVSWVSHGGVVCTGVKSVLTYQGLTATEDHDVWTVEYGKVSLGTAASKGYTLVVSGREAVPVAVGTADVGSCFRDLERWVQKGLGLVSWLRASLRVLRGQLVGREDNRVQVPPQSEVPKRLTGTHIRDSLRFHGAAVRAGFARLIQELQGAGYSGAVRFAGALHTVGVSHVPAHGFQEAGLRPRGQRWAVFSNESSVVYSQREPTQQAARLAKVYDIVNAGPLHRFTCEGVLVSNCYGMGAEGLQEYSRKSYGVVMSLTEATEARDRYFTLYNALPKWHAAYKEAAHKHEQIRSPLGRIRHLPLINGPDQDIRAMQERQSVNSPVQSTLSDMALLSMVELDRAYPDLWVFGMTHDSLEMYVPEDDLEGWAYRVKDVMENLPLGRLGWSPKVRFTVDAGVSLVNLAELAKVGKSKA